MMQPTIRFIEHTRTIRRVLPLVVICLISALIASCVNPRPDLTARRPPPPPPTFRQAVKEYYGGHYYESISTLHRLVSAHSVDSRALWELVHLYEETGNYSQAVRPLVALRGLEPDNPAIENSLFDARVLGAQFAAAKAMLPTAQPTYETLFYEAYLQKQLGNSAQAKTLLEKSLSAHAHQPMAWYLLGDIAYSGRDYAAAETDFRKVLHQNQGWTMAIPPLARSILAQGKEKAAYPLLLRARDILPNDTQIKQDISTLESKYPELVKAHAEANSQRQQDTVPPRVSTFPAPSELAPYIRVALAEHLHALTIKTGGNYEIRSLSPGNSLAYRGPGDEVLHLKREGSSITLSKKAGTSILSWSSPVVLRYFKPEYTTVVFNLVTEAGSFFATSGDRAYRGEMIFRPGKDGFTVVNRLPLEEYLYSVLPSEMYSFWPLQALEAQAVAARSYTLASVGSFASKGFDVYGSVRSAAYRGVLNESPLTTKAVNATQGQVLELDGKPLKAYYSANSGGYTENSTVVWGEHDGMAAVPDILTPPRPHDLSLTHLYAWLTGSPPSYSAIPPCVSQASYHLVKWVAAAEIAHRANHIKKIGKLIGIVTRGRGVSGRVSKLELIGTEGDLSVNGDAIRAVLGDIRSALFVMRPVLAPDGSPRYYIFTGGGWGHGVGMDQDGAAGMAAAGYTFQQILAHYYPRARLTTYRSLPAKAKLPDAAAKPTTDAH